MAAIVPAGLYSLIVVSFDRYEREPWRVLLGAFGWGAVMAVFFSLIFGTILQVLLGVTLGEGLAEFVSAGIGAPLIEESFKGIALIGLLLMFRDEFDNVLDGLVYGALIGLGFAMTENVLYLGGAYLQGGTGGLGELFVARIIFGGFGHALYTGTTGAALGWVRERVNRGPSRFFIPFAGWGLAVFQHFLWNTGTLVVGAVIATLRGDMNLSIIPVVILSALIFTGPGLIVLVVVALIASRRESRVIREQLAGEVATGVLTPQEYETLAHARSRRQALGEAYRRGGLRAWLTQQRFFQAAAELAFRKHRLSRGERLPSAGLRTSDDEYRAQLAALRVEGLKVAGRRSLG
ncbi:MAG: FIG00448137: hypothetical protein [uncultured Thermomicrobiales bacterium]|uniref:PrsW family intramembrane metalloprotease n=1 Tax=uncultured Thermomicrobiales bacterium TaxID=1645740 RepID=A0A6J4VRI3_9BACT|nr:MAG: FIG00448137: hypothetical protein [uncultured Thermomicrobiales bacterium]